MAAFLDHLDRWLIERILLVAFSTILVHTLQPSRSYVVQALGAIAGLALYETGDAFIRSITARKGNTE